MCTFEKDGVIFQSGKTISYRENIENISPELIAEMTANKINGWSMFYYSGKNKVEQMNKYLIVIILALLVYLAFKPSGDKKYLDMIEQANNKIVKQIEANQKLIEKQIADIKLIEKKETIIRNYYNEIISSADTITTDVSAITSIRRWLDSLGTARFD